MLWNLTSASATNKINLSQIFFVFEIFTVTVVYALVLCNFLHKFLVTILPCSMPAMFTTNKRLLQANIRALLPRSVESWVGIQILWDMFRLQIAELWFPYDGTVAIDCRRSQKCVSIWSQTTEKLFAISNPRSSAMTWKPVVSGPQCIGKAMLK